MSVTGEGGSGEIRHGRDKVVDEPDDGDCGEAEPVAAEDEQVRHFGVPHGVALIPRRLLHAQPPNEDEHGRDEAEPEREAPDRAEVIVPEAREEVRRWLKISRR